VTIAAVAEAVKKTPSVVICRLADGHGVSRHLICQLINDQLDPRGPVIPPRPLLRTVSRVNVVKRSHTEINRAKHTGCWKEQIFGDEKMFMVDADINCYNSRYHFDLPVTGMGPNIHKIFFPKASSSRSWTLM